METQITYIVLPFAEYLPADELIPRPDGKKCPTNTQYKKNEKEHAGNIFDLSTCSCEEHCAWDLCRLANPPKKCLRGTRSQWQWDSFKNAWVAQVNEGNKFYSKNTIRISKFLCLPNNVEKYLTFILRLTECYSYHNGAVRQT